MADSSYQIEIRIANKNGWFTADEARNYYGRYARDNYIVHWWGAPGQVGDHDGTVNYILGQAAAGNMSVNYVVSDQKITLVVPPDAVSWGAQGGNPTGVNVEHSPYLSAEGYKKAGWLKDQLEQRWSKRLMLKKHSDYSPTACPGTIDVNRIEHEAQKWRSGEHDRPLPPPTPPAPPEPQPQAITPVIKYTIANARLVTIKDMTAIKTYPTDVPMDIAATCTWNGNQFYLTRSSFEGKRLTGFLTGDLKDASSANPSPSPPIIVTPPAPFPEPVRDTGLRTILIAFFTALATAISVALASLNK